MAEFPYLIISLRSVLHASAQQTILVLYVSSIVHALTTCAKIMQHARLLKKAMIVIYVIVNPVLKVIYVKILQYKLVLIQIQIFVTK